MPIDDDLSAMLPPAPPPRPARRDAAIGAAMRRFDGEPGLAEPVSAALRPGWLRRPQAGLLASALVVAVIGVPATLIVLRDQPVAPARDTSPLPSVAAPRQATPLGPSWTDARTGEPAALATPPASGSVAPPATQEKPPARVAPKRTVESVTADRAESERSLEFAPAPPPPPPPPPAPAAQVSAAPREVANRAADTADLGDVVVTGSRVRPTAEMRDDKSALARKGRPNDSLDQSSGTMAREPRSASAFLDRALDFQRQGKLTLALADLDRAYRLDPRDRRVLRQRGAVYRQLGDIRRAERDERLLRQLDAE